MLKNKIKKDQGFTIIEVLIVLAIAGLILLVVFLAVPNLQRTARNTTRKTDAAAVASAVTNYVDNNSGTLPTALAADATANTLDVCGAGGGSNGGATACTGNVETAKLGYYAPANIYIAGAVTTATDPTVVATSTANSTTKINTEGVIIIPGEGCSNFATGANNLDTRLYAVFYVTEGGSGNGSLQCIEQ